MPTDLPRITARLEAAGLSPILCRLLTGPLTETIELSFGSLSIAKRAQAMLYSWLSFFPEIKARTSLRLNLETGTLYVMGKVLKERRGRRRLA